MCLLGNLLRLMESEGHEDVIECPVAVANLPDRCSPVGLCEIHRCTREDCYCRTR